MTYKKFYEKYCGGTWEVQDDGGVTSKEFDQFSRDFKSVLKEICSLDWEIEKYSKGHYFVSTFLRNAANPEKFLYLNVGDIRHNSNWYGRILYRTAENEKDYRGGTNQYSSLENLQNALERENRMIGEELRKSRKNTPNDASIFQPQIREAEKGRGIYATETRGLDKTDSSEAAKESIMTEKKVYEYNRKAREYKDALRLAYNSGAFPALEKLGSELGLSDEECKGLEKPYFLAQKAQAEGKELHFNEICDCHHMELFDEADGRLKWESIDHSGIEYLEVGDTYIEKCSSGGYGTSNAFISIGESIENLYVEYGERHFPEEAAKDGKIFLFDHSESNAQSVIDDYIKTRFNIMSPSEIEAEYTESLGAEGEELSSYLKQVENKEFYDLDWNGDVCQINNLIHNFDDVDLYVFKPPFQLNQDIQLVAWDERDRPIIQEIDTENGFINLLHDLHDRFVGNKDYESEVLALKNLIEAFAKGKNKERYLKSVRTFENDREKMEDFFRISKDEFLTAYSYLDETEYDATALKVNEKYRLKEPVHADLRLGELFNGIITEEEKRDGSDTVVLSSGSTIERSGSEQEGFAFDMRNKNDSTYLAFDGMRATRIAEIDGISYFTNNDERMYWQGEVFSLNDDEIRLAFDSQGQGLLSKEAEKSEDKTVFLSIDAAKSLIFDDEIVYDKENGTLDFYAWATDTLMEQFVPSEKRLGLEDSANEFYFDFIYKDEQNISLRLSYYDKDDKKVYETFRISPESESFDFLRKLMDDYAMRSDGKHIEDYKVLDGLEALKYAKLSQIANASATPLFSDEMSRKVIDYYEQQGISLYKNNEDELFAYHKNHDNSKREYEESPVEKWRLYDVIKNFIDGYDRNPAAGDMLNQFEEVRASLAAGEINRERVTLDLQERFKDYTVNDTDGLPERITSNSVKTEKPAAERTWEEIGADWNKRDFADARNRSKEILEENKSSFTDRELKKETVYQLLHDYIAVDSELSGEELSFNSSVLEEMSEKYVSNELQLDAAQNYFDEKREEWKRKNHTEKELRFEFADDTNTEKIRICKEPFSQCDIIEEIKDYLKIRLKVEKDIDFDFYDERNYAYYDFDSMHSPTYFVLCNDMSREKSNPYVAVRFYNKAYELLGRDLTFNAAQSSCASRIEIESNIENHGGHAQGTIVHDVEAWEDAQDKQNLNESTEQKCYERYVEVWKLNHVLEKGISESASFNEFMDNEFRDAKTMKGCLSESLFKEYADGIKAFCKNKVEQGNGITLDEANNLSDTLSLLDKDSIKPSGEQILVGLEWGWKFDEVCRGYIESGDQDLPDGVLVIMRIDDMQVFGDDHEAAIQAEKDGIKLIPKEEMSFELDEDGETDERSHYDYIDTPKNRKLLQEAGLLRDKGNRHQIGEEISLDLKTLFNNEKYRPSGFDNENERITGGTSLWLENTSNRIEFSRDGSETYYDLVDEVGTVLAMEGEPVIVAEHKDGMYRLIANEDSEMPHTFYLSESDFEIATGKASLSQLINEHNKNNALLEEAKGLISDFCYNEYISMPDFSDLRRVRIAYTEYFDPETQKEYPIQVSVNLIEPSITATFDGKELWKDDNYEDLQDFIATGLDGLDFDSLVSVADYDINAILKGEHSSTKSDAMSAEVNGNCLGWEDEIEAWLNENFYRETEYFNGSKTMGKYSHTLSPSIAKPITESELKLFENKTEPPEEILNRIKDSKFDEAYDAKVASIVSDLQEYMRSSYDARLSSSDISDYLIADEKLQVLQPSNEEWLLLEPKETIEKLTKVGIRFDGIQQNENQEENEMESNEKTTEKETMPVYAYSPFGYEGVLVQIETDLRRGIPTYDIVGISDGVSRETKDRIRAAFRNSDLEFPKERILQSASPADLKKEGRIDLAMAVSILSQTEDYIKEPVMVLGELEPSGKVRPVRGNAAAVITALNAGIRNIVCDSQAAKEIEGIKGIRILEVESLAEANAGLRSLENFRETGTENLLNHSNEVEFSTEHDDEDLSVVMRGNYDTIRAMEIAAAGKHNMLITGEPGCEKTVLNQYLLPKITPKLTGEESLIKQRIWSIAGLHSQRNDKRTAPFRMPHQTASIEGMCGGGAQARPGEISLAHHGTLFLDEAAMFRTSVLQMLRIPLETKTITLSRAGRSTVYPADFQLSLAMNPCPCGHYKVLEKICLDSAMTIKQYWNKVPSPVLERIEIKNFMQKNENDTRKTTLKEMRGRIATAIKIQRERGVYNSHLNPQQVAQYCKINDEDRKLLDWYSKRFDISQRNIANTLKVALTIANMNGRVHIRTNDLREAMEMTAPVFDKPQKYQFDPAFPDGKDLTDELAGSIREDIRNAIGSIDENIKINGMRFYQPPEDDGKLHLAVEYEADDWREDGLFNALAEEHFTLNGREVDVNPITPAKSGTLDEYIKIVENADKIIAENDRKLNAREEMKKNLPGEGIEITPDDLKYAKKFLPKGQYSLVLQNTQGEEGEHFKQIIKSISEKARAIKGKTEILDKDGKHPLAFKYTLPNDTKFYISEWNGDDEVFGYTVLKGDTQMSEWGYSSLSEIRDLSIKDQGGFPVTSEMTFYGLEPTIEKMAASDFPELAADMGEEKKSREEEMVQEFSRKLNEALLEKNLEPTTENIALASYHVMHTMDSAEKKELISLMEKCGCTDEAKSNEFLSAAKNYETPDGKTKIKQILETLSKKPERAPKVEDELEAGI